MTPNFRNAAGRSAFACSTWNVPSNFVHRSVSSRSRAVSISWSARNRVIWSWTVSPPPSGKRRSISASAAAALGGVFGLQGLLAYRQQGGQGLCIPTHTGPFLGHLLIPPVHAPGAGQHQQNQRDRERRH